MHDCINGCGAACDCDGDDTWLDTPGNYGEPWDAREDLLTDSERSPSLGGGEW